MELNPNFQMHPSLNSHQLYGIDIEMNTTLDKNTTPSEKYQDQIDEDCEGCTMSCFLCQQIFTDIDELQEHLSIHYVQYSDLERTAQYFNCKFCGRTLRSEADLKEHHKRYHEATAMRKEIESEESVSCKLCGYICESSYILLKHVELTHVPKTEKTKQITAEPAPMMYAAFQYSGPKIKYPPRSPHFNPNLWMDPNGYI